MIQVALRHAPQESCVNQNQRSPTGPGLAGRTIGGRRAQAAPPASGFLQRATAGVANRAVVEAADDRGEAGYFGVPSEPLVEPRDAVEVRTEPVRVDLCVHVEELMPDIPKA